MTIPNEFASTLCFVQIVNVAQVRRNQVLSVSSCNYLPETYWGKEYGDGRVVSSGGRGSDELGLSCFGLPNLGSQSRHIPSSGMRAAARFRRAYSR